LEFGLLNFPVLFNECDMKRRVVVLTIWLALPAGAWAQGTINFTNYTTTSISFVVLSNAPLDYLPSGSARIFSGKLSFDATIKAPVPASENPFLTYMDGTLLQMDDGGSLSPIPGLSPAFNQSAVTLGTPSTCEFATSGIWVDADVFQSLLDGGVFVEAHFSYGDYLGQILAVPEPSCLSFTLWGAGFVALARPFASRKPVKEP
jgi:hypothetical protein